jgi:hypothetical protein
MENNPYYQIAKKIWPSIQRVLTDVFYFLFVLVRGIVRIAINQVKGK